MILYDQKISVAEKKKEEKIESVEISACLSNILFVLASASDSATLFAKLEGEPSIFAKTKIFGVQ